MNRRIVVKVGTSTLTGGSKRLDRGAMVELVRQCAALYRSGVDVILCSSGAIAAGRERLALYEPDASLATKQMLAAVGQSRLMHVWESLFEIYDIHVGQVLLTREDVNDRRRFLNARDTLQALLEHRIVPIINENDAVATAEIRVGDNDNLSALVSIVAEADVLVLLTDQPGLYTADPRTHPEAELIPEVRVIDQSVRSLAGGSVSGLGVGGMATKLQAADTARRGGVDVIIAAGNLPGVLERIAAGEPVGTRFPAIETPLENRKRWILAGASASGRIVIDSGAVGALVGSGSSLLPAGIVSVHGNFGRGDTVSILGPAGEELARGIARYDAADLQRIRGRRSEQIAETLGYAFGPVAVHRNDLVLK